jgi:hypothetical protein
MNLDNLQDAEKALKLLRAELKVMSSDLVYIRDSFTDTVNELSKQNEYLIKAKSALRGISSLASKIVEHRKGEASLTVRELEKIQHKAKLQQQDLTLATKSAELTKTQRTAILASIEDSKLFTKELEKTISLEQKINKEIGLTGTGLAGLAKFMSQLGFADLSKPFADAIEKTKAAKRELPELQAELRELEKTGGGIGIGGDLEPALTGIQQEIKEYQELMQDPKSTKEAAEQIKRLQEEEGKLKDLAAIRLKSKQEEVAQTVQLSSKYRNVLAAIKSQLTLTNLVDFSIGKIVQSFFAINKASVEYSRLTGQNISNQAAYNSKLVTAVDFLKAAGELTELLGRNADSAFTKETIATVADFKNQLGLSGQEAGNLAMFAQATGTNLEQNTKSLVKQVSAFNGANKSAVSQGKVLRDVANTSAGIAVSLGTNPKRLAEAASQAARLGLSLKDVEGIAQSLLNFESSIEAELEAQLLTGKNINLAKARELALTNQLDKLGEEVFKNTSDIAEYGNMNYLAQEAYAKSLGMTRDQLARTAYLKAIDAGMTEKQAADAAKIGLEDMKRMDVQERLNKAIEKMAGLLAAPAEFLANMLESSLGMGIALTAMTAMIGVSLVNSLGNAVRSMRMLAIFSKRAAIAKAWGAAMSGPQALLTGGLAGAVIGGTLTALIMSSMSKEDDMVSPGYGKRILSSPEGTIALNNNDTVVAGTNLFQGNTQSGEGGITTMSMQPLIAEIQSMKQELKAVLNTIANKEGSVYLDTDLVGKALVLGSTRM